MKSSTRAFSRLEHFSGGPLSNPGEHREVAGVVVSPVPFSGHVALRCVVCISCVLRPALSIRPTCPPLGPFSLPLSRISNAQDAHVGVVTLLTWLRRLLLRFGFCRPGGIARFERTIY